MNTVHLKEEFRKLLNSVNADFERLEGLENVKASDFESFVPNLDALYKKGIVFAHVNAITESTEIEEPEDDKNTFIGNPIEFSDLLKDVENQQLENASIEQVEPIKIETIVEPENPIEQVAVVVDLKEEAPIVLNPVVEEIPVVELANPEIKKEPNLNLVDIKTNIGINDKFQFISELFANNVDAYETAIKKLNADSSLDSSLLVLEEIKKENNWKDESEAGQRFEEIVKRRFL